MKSGRRKTLSCSRNELRIFLKNLGIDLRLKQNISYLRFNEKQIRQALKEIVPTPKKQKTDKAFKLFVRFYYLFCYERNGHTDIQISPSLLVDADVLPRKLFRRHY